VRISRGFRNVMNRKERRAERKQQGGRTPAGVPSTSMNQLFTTAVRHHQAGQLAEAETLYRQILAIDKDHVDSLHHLGLVAHQVGDNARAAELIGRAILLNDRIPDFHYNIGLVLQALGRLDDAVWHGERAIALKPDYAEAHNNLGTVLFAKGQHEAAAARHRQALALNPNMAEAHFNLGNAYLAQRQWDQAINSYGQALSHKPDYAEAHDNLGSALRTQGKLEEADAHVRQALALKLDLVGSLNNRAESFILDEKPEQALPLVRRALSVQETYKTRALFGECLRELRSVPTDPDFRGLLVRAMSEPWDRPYVYVRAALALVKHKGAVRDCVKRATDAWPRRLPAQELFGSFGLAAVAKDQVLRCLLETGPNSDIELERFLTSARHALLEAAATGGPVSPDDAVLGFYCALAAQCFINEYVFDHTEEELDRARALRGSLGAAIEAGAPVPVLWPVAVAAYFPLGAVPGAQSLLDRAWPDAVTGLLVQQVREPAEERQYRPTIARLTAIADDVSIRVQRQYEENPYPRWVKATSYGPPVTVDADLRALFPTALFQPLGKTSGVDILIAGCGSGRRPVEAARYIAGARVLAVDLSLDSLCYAARMTRQLGIDNVEYAQADILALGSIGRTFDVIEAGGVLHHLAKPMAGWRILLSLLRPGGVMSVGLYSELARSDIKAAQAHVAKRGYGPTAEDIRRCRQELMGEPDPQIRNVCQSGDFFTTSECRDMLFHVQEHRFEIPQISTFLAQNDLDFLGFVVGTATRRQYGLKFLDDPARTNLAHWHVFETENPDTFIDMYLFWVQKKPSPRPAVSVSTSPAPT
jgi:tetratricopeptide (TPR) repeat protein/SAM-dependent methyltransferase